MGGRKLATAVIDNEARLVLKNAPMLTRAVNCSQGGHLQAFRKLNRVPL